MHTNIECTVVGGVSCGRPSWFTRGLHPRSRVATPAGICSHRALRLSSPILSYTGFSFFQATCLTLSQSSLTNGSGCIAPPILTLLFFFFTGLDPSVNAEPYKRRRNYVTPPLRQSNFLGKLGELRGVRSLIFSSRTCTDIMSRTLRRAHLIIRKAEEGVNG